MKKNKSMVCGDWINSCIVLKTKNLTLKITFCSPPTSFSPPPSLNLPAYLSPVATDENDARWQNRGLRGRSLSPRSWPGLTPGRFYWLSNSDSKQSSCKWWCSQTGGCCHRAQTPPGTCRREESSKSPQVFPFPHTLNDYVFWPELQTGWRSEDILFLCLGAFGGTSNIMPAAKIFDLAINTVEIWFFHQEVKRSVVPAAEICLGINFLQSSDDLKGRFSQIYVLLLHFMYPMLQPKLITYSSPCNSTSWIHLLPWYLAFHWQTQLNWATDPSAEPVCFTIWIWDRGSDA